MGTAVYNGGSVSVNAGEVGAQEGEDFLMFGSGEGDGGFCCCWRFAIGGGRQGVERSGEVSQAVADPEVEDAGIPRLVKIVGFEGSGGVGAGWPIVAAESGELGV